MNPLDAIALLQQQHPSWIPESAPQWEELLPILQSLGEVENHPKGYRLHLNGNIYSFVKRASTQVPQPRHELWKWLQRWAALQTERAA